MGRGQKLSGASRAGGRRSFGPGLTKALPGGGDQADVRDPALVFSGHGRGTHRDVGPAPSHGAALKGAGREVDLVDAGAADDLRDLVGLDTAAGEDVDPAGGLLDERGDGVERFDHRGRAATGQDALEAEFGEDFEGAGEVAADIEGAVEDGRKAVACIKQGFDGGKVERPVGFEAAEHHGIRPEVAGQLDVGGHGKNFLRAVGEVAAARADHEGDLTRKQGAGLGEDAGAGSQAAFGERSAEFDAVRPGFGAGDDGVEGINTDFEKHWGSGN